MDSPADAPNFVPRPVRRATFAWILAISLPLYVLDQATKWWIVKNFAPYQDERVIIPGWFTLCHWQNTGAAFSLGTGNNHFFMILSAVVLVALAVFIRRRAFDGSWSRWGVAFLIAGILGNLTDRLIHGHVVDFLLFDLHVRYAHPWPAFNVADSCIFMAVGIFMIASFLEKPAKQLGS